MAIDATTNPWQTIILFILQMLGAAILAFLGNRYLRRIQSQEERRSRQFEDDMEWFERYLSAMSLCLDVLEAMRKGHVGALPLRLQAAQELMQITPERDARLIRIMNLNDAQLNLLIRAFNEQSREFGIEDLQVSLEELASSASDELLSRMRLTLLGAKLRTAQLRSEGPAL